MSDTTRQAAEAALAQAEKVTAVVLPEPAPVAQVTPLAQAAPAVGEEIRKRMGEIDPKRETVIHCKMGGRSAKAVDFLRSVGFKKVLNLTGGITRWSDEVDPTVPKY